MSTTTKPITVEEYHRMIADGTIAEGARLELIEGELVPKMTEGSKHRVISQATQEILSALLPPGWHAASEKPVTLPDQGSEPEPDVSVVRGKIRDYYDGHPGPAQVGMVVEVSCSSLAVAREKALLYASAGIPRYWIVDVDGRRVEYYSDPVQGIYRNREVLSEADKVPLILGDLYYGLIRVADLLP